MLSLNNQRKRYHTALVRLNISSLSRREISRKELCVCMRIGVVRNMVYMAGNEKEIAGKMGRRLAEPRNAREHADIARSFFLLASWYTLRDLWPFSSAGAQCQVHRSTLVLRALTHSLRFLFGHNYASCANALVRRRSCVFVQRRVPARPETFSAVSIDSSRPFACTWLSSSCVTLRIGSLLHDSWRIDFLPAVGGCLMLDRYWRVISLGLFDVRLS